MELTEQEPETEPVGQGMQTSEPVLPEIVPGTCVCVCTCLVFQPQENHLESAKKIDQANR